MRKDPSDNVTTDTTRDNPGSRLFKSILFTLVGSGLMVSALIWGASTRRFVARAASAPGLVVRLNHSGAHLEVRFTTAAGKVVEYAQGGLIWGCRTVDKVVVLYDPQVPTDPVIRTVGALWALP